MRIREKLTTLRDYVEGATPTPTPTLSNMTLREAINEAEQWHEELQASGKKLQLQDDQDIIHQFNDGYY
jgi:hypothetical protein